MKRLLLILLLLQFNAVSANDIESSDDAKYADFVVRFFSQGGFSDSRSPEGKLGGVQLALDVKPVKSPIALSISTEFYTNRRFPSHSYEISDVTFLNVLYMSQLLHFENTRYFLGGGIGKITVPRDNEKDKSVEGTAYDLELGVNKVFYWKIGFYGAAKYLYAKKSEQNQKVINFNEAILLLGFTFNFSL